MKNRVYETMTKARCGAYTVRVWVVREDFFVGPEPKVLAVLYENRDVTPHSIGLALDRLNESSLDVSAYEILDDSGNGSIVYPDWP